MILAILDQRINAINKNEIPIEYLFQGNPLILNLYFSETHINEITLLKLQLIKWITSALE